MTGHGPAEDLQPSRARIAVLGGLRVWRIDGSEVDPQEFRTLKTRHLLRLLALHGVHGVSTASVVDELWPSVTEDRGRASLRTAASQLRHTLGHDHVRRRGDTLRLVDAVVDIDVFADHARLARQAAASGDVTAALRAAAVALDTYGGDVAADEPFLESLIAAQHEWRSAYREFALVAADLALRAGQTTQAVGFAEHVLRSDPTSERATRLLIEAYLALAEPGAAVRTYDRLRHSLQAELGIEPSAVTMRLLRAVDRRDVGAAAV